MQEAVINRNIRKYVPMSKVEKLLSKAGIKTKQQTLS